MSKSKEISVVKYVRIPKDLDERIKAIEKQLGTFKLDVSQAIRECLEKEVTKLEKKLKGD